MPRPSVAIPAELPTNGVAGTLDVAAQKPATLGRLGDLGHLRILAPSLSY